MIENTKAIILHGRKYSESSKIITAFTNDFGKISLLAKGARKPKNKFGSTIEPINCSSITFYSKSAGLHILSNSEEEVNIRKIKKSYEHTAVAMMIMEAISQTKIESDQSPELFEITVQILKEMNSLKENPFNYFIYFQLVLSQIVGFAISPGFESKKDLLRFSLEHGTYIENIMNASRKLIVIPNKTASLLYKIYDTSLEEISEITLQRDEITKIFDLFVSYFSFHFDKPIKFTSFTLLDSYL